MNDAQTAPDHEHIWLEPNCAGTARTWSEDNAWPAGCEEVGCDTPPTEYVRADLVREAETSALRRAAEIADIWAQTQPVSGAQASLIASVTRFTAAKIAAQIRALARTDARSWRVIEEAIPTPDLLRKEHFEP